MSPFSQNPEAIGQSEAFLNLQERISRAARTDRPVIFIGERGTGKELAAARLHQLSARWKNPYITLNCASLTPTLIESELFGHEAGAFTGATRRRKGRFEMADGGSLFLDEAGNIPMTAQEKILRVVEYGHLERVGSSESIRADVRLIAATNADLRAMAREGKFREDLLDRLSFEVITLPPLRNRREDILPLARHFARRMAGELRGAEEAEREGERGMARGEEKYGRHGSYEEGWEGVRFGERAERALVEYSWPGNIRELKNVVERMVYRAVTGGAERVAGGEGRREIVIDDIVFDPFQEEFAPRSPAEGEKLGSEAWFSNLMADVSALERRVAAITGKPLSGAEEASEEDEEGMEGGGREEVGGEKGREGQGNIEISNLKSQLSNLKTGLNLGGGSQNAPGMKSESGESLNRDERSGLAAVAASLASKTSAPSETSALDALPLPEAVRELELRRLRAALEQTRYHQRNAAALLGITYHQFRNLYRKYQTEL